MQPNVPAPRPAGGVPRWVAPTLVTLAGLTAVGVTAVVQPFVWVAHEILVISGYPVPGVFWPGLTVLTALGAGAPAALAWLLVKRPVIRAIARLWTLAAVCAALLGLVRAVPWSAGDAVADALEGVVALVLAFALRRWVSDAEAPGTRSPRVGTAVAVACGLLVLLPWWWVGALGGPLDVVAAALAASGLGVLMSRLRRTGPLRVPVGGPVAGLVLDALVLAVPLALLAGAFGSPGTQLLLLGVLPAGCVALACVDPVRRWSGALLVALAAFGPLAFVDAEEVTLLLVPGDVPQWAAIGTGISAWLALVAGAVVALGLVIAARRTKRAAPVTPPIAPPEAAGREAQAELTAGVSEAGMSEAGMSEAGAEADRPVGRAVGGRGRVLSGALIGVLVVSSGLLWLGPGQDGFHGDRLFVVLKNQAETTAVGDSTTDLTARRTAVYRLLVEHARRTQASLLSALRKVGADPTSYYLVNAVEVDDTPLVRAVLAARDDVAAVQPNPELRPIPEAATAGSADTRTLTGTPANLETIKAPQAWREGTDGRGIVVGFSDSGVDARHEALRDTYRGGADSWHDPWNRTTVPTDPNGHGTHTAGSAVGKKVGVAPGATWIGCANLARPLGNPGLYLDCLQFMLAPFRAGGDPFADGDPARAADVLSNSWGCPDVEGCGAGTLEPAVEALRDAGVFVVAAAGNEGPRCRSITDPIGRYDSVFTVGAVDDKKVVAGFSSRGPVPGDAESKPDLTAPGVDVLSAWPGGGYSRLSGTSMATPQVAGVVALIWQAAPSLRGDIVRTAALLRASTQNATLGSAPSCGGNARNVLGAGTVDAAAAVTLARQGEATRPR
ncbi:S8 family serine peptidase [Cryptosporangium arvum]|uniref:Subtilisin-like serine protease n=1 Tax=Cryptosporangium arvum DSM 44712 TaxID=927661 RepID=A0A010ZLE8_9ACTN|nr:S8 family serine peptidase [Cryptosporangium arvum]EXG79494.1 subtilisin-like serine protease [Cryptosporangium arvum DSM 44712]